MSHPIASFLRQSWLVLVLATGLSAGLASVDFSLRDQIAQNASRRVEQAVLEVVPDGVASAPVTIAGVPVYRVTNGSGDLCGWAAPAEGRGFQDRIRLLVGLSKDGGQVTGLTVLESYETPGLGDRIAHREFRDQFIGQSTAQKFTRVKPGESAPAAVHAITGATISSQAVIHAINSQLAVIRDEISAQPPAPAELPP